MELQAVEKFLLSFPVRPELYLEFEKRFPGMPAIIINQEKEIVFGIDFYHHLKKNLLQGNEEIEVFRGDFSDREALILAFNLKHRLWGVNLYEQLIFVKRIIDYAERSEIYETTDLDIAINRELLDKLDFITGEEFEEILVAERITVKSALRLCDLEKRDRESLLELFDRVPFTSSQQLQILEMSEEILFRDKVPLEKIFANLNIKQYFDREKPQPEIIAAIFTYRFPAYSEQEREWQEEIKRLKLPAHVKISHYPFFEKKELELKIRVPGPAELKRILEAVCFHPALLHQQEKSLEK